MPRIRTKFGVVIPPWRPNRRPKPITVEFVLTGLIPSKKNRQRASFNYTWAIAQVKKYFKNRNVHETITVPEMVKFVTGLIRNIKPFIFKPQEIVEWENAAKIKITEQAAEWSRSFAKQGLIFPVKEAQISIKHYWADEYQRDNSNRAETLHDLLVDANIIVDDNYKCLFKNESESACYKDEIVDHITTMHLTIYRW